MTPKYKPFFLVKRVVIEGLLDPPVLLLLVGMFGVGFFWKCLLKSLWEMGKKSWRGLVASFLRFDFQGQLATND